MNINNNQHDKAYRSSVKSQQSGRHSSHLHRLKLVNRNGQITTSNLEEVLALENIDCAPPHELSLQEQQSLEHELRHLVRPGKGVLDITYAINALMDINPTPTVNRAKHIDSYFTLYFSCIKLLYPHASGFLLSEDMLKHENCHVWSHHFKEQAIHFGVKLKTTTTYMNCSDEPILCDINVDAIEQKMEYFKAEQIVFVSMEAEFKITLETPSIGAVEANCRVLAHFATIAQKAGLVPIISIGADIANAMSSNDLEMIMKTLITTLRQHNTYIEGLIIRFKAATFSSREVTPHEHETLETRMSKYVLKTPSKFKPRHSRTVLKWPTKQLPCDGKIVYTRGPVDEYLNELNECRRTFINPSLHRYKVHYEHDTTKVTHEEKEAFQQNAFTSKGDMSTIPHFQFNNNSLQKSRVHVEDDTTKVTHEEKEAFPNNVFPSIGDCQGKITIHSNKHLRSECIHTAERSECIHTADPRLTLASRRARVTCVAISRSLPPHLGGLMLQEEDDLDLSADLLNEMNKIPLPGCQIPVSFCFSRVFLDGIFEKWSDMTIWPPRTLTTPSRPITFLYVRDLLIKNVKQCGLATMGARSGPNRNVLFWQVAG